MDIKKYYEEHKNDIQSELSEFASDYAAMKLSAVHLLPFEAFVEPEDTDDPDGATCYKEEFQEEFDKYYDEIYGTIANIFQYDYCEEDGVQHG